MPLVQPQEGWTWEQALSAAQNEAIGRLCHCWAVLDVFYRGGAGLGLSDLLYREVV